MSSNTLASPLGPLHFSPPSLMAKLGFARAKKGIRRDVSSVSSTSTMSTEAISFGEQREGARPGASTASWPDTNRAQQHVANNLDVYTKRSSTPPPPYTARPTEHYPAPEDRIERRRPGKGKVNVGSVEQQRQREGNNGDRRKTAICLVRLDEELRRLGF
ncbi:uncharacterized protein JCM15063_003391 [Sporobolomyces koalae]|uniref:uncharacterized protein n=1 Tax=Sporobolomyces koalae TaxID=500713 RepID=UPI00316F66B9